MTAYHLYTRTKPVRWYDPFRLDDSTPPQSEVQTLHTNPQACVYSLLQNSKRLSAERSA